MKRIAKMRRQSSRARGETIVRPKTDCAIIPKKPKGETRFDSFQQFVFETVLRLIALRVTDSRMRPQEYCRSLRRGIRLWRERIDHRVHSFPCTLHHTVGDVLSGKRRIFRYVLRSAGRPSLKAANAKPQREKY